MISFVGKAVEAPIVIEGKPIKGKVVWKNGVFRLRVGKEHYEIADCNDLSDCKYMYALPTNTYYNPWTKKPYFPPDKPDKDAMEMRLRFWGKYFQGMTLFGKLDKDNIFHPRKRHECNISEINKGTTNSDEVVPTVV